MVSFNQQNKAKVMQSLSTLICSSKRKQSCVESVNAEMHLKISILFGATWNTGENRSLTTKY